MRIVRTSATGTSVLLAVGLAVLGLAGCGQKRHGNSSATPAQTASARAGFIVAADGICARHLGIVLAWLEKPQTGNVWQQHAIQNDGIYRIMAATISHLQTLGRPPGPTSEAFAGYLKSLEERAALYRLTGAADRRRDPSSAAHLQRRVAQIDTIGDRDARRYGLQICGAGARDILPQVDRGGSVLE